MGYRRQDSAPPHPPTPTRIPYLKNYQSRGHKLDRKLWDECAYYPREGCQFCRWDWPYPKCDVAHILVDTRCAGVTGWKPNRGGSKGGEGSKKQTKKEKFWDALPKELQEELKQMIKRG